MYWLRVLKGCQGGRAIIVIRIPKRGNGWYARSQFDVSPDRVGGVATEKQCGDTVGVQQSQRWSIQSLNAAR